MKDLWKVSQEALRNGAESPHPDGQAFGARSATVYALLAVADAITGAGTEIAQAIHNERKPK